MTATLVYNVKEGQSNYLYVAADGRVTAGDKLISDNYNKIKVRTQGVVTRYYVLCGTVGLFDYFVNRAEQYSMSELHTKLFEDETFRNFKGSFAAFVIEQSPDTLDIYDIDVDQEDKDSFRVLVEKLDIEDLIDHPRVYGSGGFYVQTALNAHLLHEHNEYSLTTKILKSFEAAAKLILSINDKVNVVRLKIPKKPKAKKKTK